jgi:hypothetical protein
MKVSFTTLFLRPGHLGESVQFKRLARALHISPENLLATSHIPGLEDQSEIEQPTLDADAIRLCVRRYPGCKSRIGN